MIQNDKELRRYLEEARTFDQDRLLTARRSTRLAWTIASVASVIACASVVAVAALAPLKSVEPFVIRVDQATGVPEVMTALTDGREEYDEAVAKYFLALYVRTREGYSYAARSTIFNHVQIMSGPEEGPQFSNLHTGTWQPMVDIYETQESLVIVVELPGLNEEDISVKMDQGILKIRGFRPKQIPDATRHVHQMEIPYGHFARYVNLPECANIEKIEAEYKNGYLTIEVPRGDGS